MGAITGEPNSLGSSDLPVVLSNESSSTGQTRRSVAKRDDTANLLLDLRHVKSSCGELRLRGIEQVPSNDGHLQRFGWERRNCNPQPRQC